MRIGSAVFVALIVTACSPPTPQAPAPAAPQRPHFELVLSDPAQLILPASSPINVSSAQAGLSLSGHAANASPQYKTGGAAIALGEQNERAFASHRVRVTVRARGVDASTFSVAYSTNDNGNSGWRELPLTDTLSEQSFDYSVPAIVRGADDFIGFMPPPSGSVEIQSIRVDVID